MKRTSPSFCVYFGCYERRNVNVQVEINFQHLLCELLLALALPLCQADPGPASSGLVIIKAYHSQPGKINRFKIPQTPQHLPRSVGSSVPCGIFSHRRYYFS